jgi:hypothetical protein
MSLLVQVHDNKHLARRPEFGDVLAYSGPYGIDDRRWMYLCHEIGNPNGGTYLSLETGTTMHWTDEMISDNFYLAEEPR